MTDSWLTSLLRGRVLAAVAGSASASLSLTAVASGALNEWTATLNGVLALVTVVAAIASKLREIWRGQDADADT
jgi:hypothetical protein